MKTYTDLIDESTQLDEAKTVDVSQFTSLSEQFMKKIERMAKMKGMKGGPKRVSSASFEKSYYAKGVDPKKAKWNAPHFTISGWHGLKPAHWGPGMILWSIYEQGDTLETVAEFDTNKYAKLAMDNPRTIPESLLTDYIKFLSKAEKEITDIIVKLSK